MLRRPLLALVAAGLSSMALAQTSPPADVKKDTPAAAQAAQQASSQTTGSAAAPAVGLKIANTANVAVRFVEVRPADFMASKLLGIDVRNNQDENLGRIQDIVFENGRSITGVVVRIGGFLGFGESYVVLDPATVVLNEKDGAWRAYVDTTKDSLENAPKFTYSGKT